MRSMQHGNDQVCWNSNISAQRRLTRAIDQYIDTLDSIDSMVHSVDLLRITKRRLEDTMFRELKNSRCYQDAPANRKRCRQTIELPSCCAFENNDIISGSDDASWRRLESDAKDYAKDYAAWLRARLVRQSVMAPSFVTAARSYSHPRQTSEPPSCGVFENKHIISGCDADSWHSLASVAEVALLRNSHGEVVDKDYAARLRARLARQTVMAPSFVTAAQSYSHPAGRFEAIPDS